MDPKLPSDLKTGQRPARNRERALRVRVSRPGNHPNQRRKKSGVVFK